MQMAFYFDQTRCTSCYTCYMACKEWHDIPARSVRLLRIEETESGKYPDVFVSCAFLTCYHCEEPSCVSVCPTNCIAKRSEDGIVLIDGANCLGQSQCGQCAEVCPYGSIQFRVDKDAKAEKCDFCWDRIAEGRQPACVSACPTRALDAGDLQDLRSRYVIYGNLRVGTGFVYDEGVKPAFAIRGKNLLRGRQ